MLLLLWISRKSKYSIEFVFAALSFGILKPTIRIYDFENTKDILSETDWSNLVLNNLIAMALQTCMLTMFYS